jgi:hypothetical protein
LRRDRGSDAPILPKKARRRTCRNSDRRVNEQNNKNRVKAERMFIQPQSIAHDLRFAPGVVDRVAARESEIARERSKRIALGKDRATVRSIIGT